MKIKVISIVIGMAALVWSCNGSKSATEPTGQEEVTLIVNPDLLTVINIMSPQEEDQDKVLTLLQEGIDGTISKLNGFVSTNLHKSTDNNYVLNYAQWSSQEDLQGAVDLINSGGAPQMAEAFSLSNPDFHPYLVTAQFSPTNSRVSMDRQGDLLTVINRIKPNDGIEKEDLAQLLKEAMAEEIMQRPGFISATVHESLDNDYIVNYAQWKDQASLDETIRTINAGGAPKLAEVFSKSNPDFHVYTIVATNIKK